jgi:hypothetical protein
MLRTKAAKNPMTGPSSFIRSKSVPRMMPAGNITQINMQAATVITHDRIAIKACAISPNLFIFLVLQYIQHM